MPITFYPYEEDVATGGVKEKLEVMLAAADRYKSIILGAPKAPMDPAQKVQIAPKDIGHAFQWQEMAVLLRQIREMPETNQTTRMSKMAYLTKLAEIYEVLRAAKMPKLEAVRIALMNEVELLKSSINAT